MIKTSPTRDQLLSRPQALLFDSDGTLIQSEPIHWAAWRSLLKELDMPYVEAELHALVGRTAPEILMELLNRHRPGWDPAKYDLNRLALRKNDFYLKIAKAELKPYPGVVECLSWARENGIKTAVVSNAKKRELQAALDSLRLAPLFDAIFSRDDVPHFKPDPTPYLIAAATLEVDPTDCIAIEDSPTGLEAALLARTVTAAVTTNFKKDFLEQPVPGRPDLRPSWIGPGVKELFERLKELPGKIQR